MKQVLKDYGPTIGIIIVLVICYFSIPSFQAEVDQAYSVMSSGDRPQVVEYVDSYGWWGPLVVIVLMTVQMFLVIVPSWLLMIVAILAYGSWWGSLLAVVAVVVASTVGHLLGKQLGEDAVTRLVGEKTSEKLTGFIDKHGSAGVIIFRLAPFLSNDGISFIAGALGMRYWRFMLATLAGIIPLTALLAYFVDDMDSLKRILLWITGISVVGYVAYVLIRKNRSK
jgi:uncharacterized membrane protein YdjX (TVP38/TMEM64 family)